MKMNPSRLIEANLLDGFRSPWVDGRIENLVELEDIVFVFLDRLAVNLFACCQIELCPYLQRDQLCGAYHGDPIKPRRL